MNLKSVHMVIAAIILVCCVGVLNAEENLTLPADYSTFYIPSDSTTYVEFYYSLYRHQLGFIGSEDNDYLYAGVLVTATLYDKNGDEAGTGSNYFLAQVEDKSELENKEIRFFDYLPMKIAPGNYRVELSAVDDVSKSVGKTELLITVPDYSKEVLTSSGLEMAYQIRDVSEDSSSITNPRLIKQDRLVIPNPTGVFQPGADSLLFVYSELYGLTSSEASTANHFIVKYTVKDSLGNIIHDFGRETNDKPGNSAVLARALDISDITPGNYYLILEAEDPASGQTAIAMHRFSLLDPPAAVATTLAEEDVNLMVDIAWYHLSEAEKIQIGDLSISGKANLVRQFWRDRDDDPSDPANPVYDEAVRRFKFANDNFSTLSEKPNGWRTDRGRVYITYGPYNERDEEVMGGRSYPYVKWTYHQVSGGCIFVFVNDFVAGAIDYRLVHSTHPREKYDPKWRDILDGEDEEDDEWRNAGDKGF